MKINILILSSDSDYNIYPVFTSENIYKEEINLFYYKSHIYLIKDLNKYLHRNNNNKQYYCHICLNSFISEINLKNHKQLCLKYNKKSEVLILPQNEILQFEKINQMIKQPFTIYYDIETYTCNKLSKPYLCGYILKCNCNDN